MGCRRDLERELVRFVDGCRLAHQFTGDAGLASCDQALDAGTAQVGEGLGENDVGSARGGRAYDSGLVDGSSWNAIAHRVRVPQS